MGAGSTRRLIFRPDGIKTLYGSGHYDPTPLRNLMLSQMTDAVLNRVAADHAKGRRLYVVTTDMTSGKSVYWNIGAIASESGSNRKARFVNILIASVAVLGLIEPVRVAEVSGAYSVHSDGGVQAPVPLAPFMLGANRSHWQTVWVIANGHVSRDTALRSDAGSTLGLARRGVSQVLRQLLYLSVEDARSRTLRVGGRFRLVALPETFAEAAYPFKLKPDEMRGLLNWAGKSGRTPSSDGRSVTFQATVSAVLARYSPSSCARAQPPILVRRSLSEQLLQNDALIREDPLEEGNGRRGARRLGG